MDLEKQGLQSNQPTQDEVKMGEIVSLLGQNLACPSPTFPPAHHASYYLSHHIVLLLLLSCLLLNCLHSFLLLSNFTLPCLLCTSFMTLSYQSPGRCLPRPRRCYSELLLPPLHPTGLSLVNSLITLAHGILDAQKSSPCQRRNLAALSRRVKILLVLLEEIRDTASTLSPSTLRCFGELHVIFQGAKLLSEDCAESSRVCLLMEHRKLSEFFRRLTQEMATTLEILPLALLDISCEVREQVELIRQQAKRPKSNVDAKESKLCAEVRFVMRQIEKKETPDISKLSEIFSSLEIRNAADGQRELERMEAEVREEEAWDIVTRARSIEERKVPLSDLMSFVRYCKCVLYGATETLNDVLEASKKKSVKEAQEIEIPDDFLCPISLELMRDPVVVATGQTYERAEITRWIDGGNRTCPKSGLMLAHTTLIPNYALSNLIRHWCMQHDVQLRTPMESSAQHRSCRVSLSTPTAVEATKLTVELLLRQLAVASLDTQRRIAGELRVLAKCGSENRKVIADAGGIPLLVPLLIAADSRIKEHAVTAVLNLSIYVPNKVQIINAPGALDHLITLLQTNGKESEVVRENAAAVLFSLSQVREVLAEMGKKPEAMEGLLQIIIKEGSERGKRDAACALFNMAVYQPNRAVLVEAGAVRVVLTMLSSRGRGEGIEEEGLALLAVLSDSSEGCGAIAKSAGVLPLLEGVLRVGSPKGKESAAAILLCLCKYGNQGGVRKLQSLRALLPLLHSLLSHGTPRARRKAASLLRILRLHFINSHSLQNIQ